jgi:hypothetical protein
MTAGTVDPTRASWGRASWGSFFGETPQDYGELGGGDIGAVKPRPTPPGAAKKAAAATP